MLCRARFWPTLVLFLSTPVVAEPPTDHDGDPLPPCAVARLGTVRWRHEGTIATLAFSPDGTLLASAGTGFVHVWDTATGRPLPRFKNRINAEVVAFSADSKTLVAALANGMVQHWDLATAEMIRQHWPIVIRSAVDPVFSPNGARVAFRDRGNDVHFVEVATGRGSSHEHEPQGAILSMALSHDGKTFATGGKREVIHLYEFGTRREPRTLKDGNGWVFALQFAPGDRVLAAATGERILVWDVTAGRIMHRLKASGGRMAFKPDGKLLAGHDGSAVVIWDMNTGKEVRRFADRGNVVELTFSPDGRTLAVAFCSRAIELWDVASGKPKHAFDGHRGAIGCLAVAPDGSLLATGSSDDQSLIVWDLAKWKPKHVLTDGALSVVSAAFSPDGTTLAAGDAFPAPDATDALIRLWDAHSGKLVRRFEAQRGVQSVAFAPDGKRIVTAGDGSIRLWDLAGKRLREMPGDEGRNGAVFSPDGNSLLTCGSSGRVSLVDAATGETLRCMTSFDKSGETVPFATFTDGGKTVLAWMPGAQDRQMLSHETAKGTRQRATVMVSRDTGIGPCALSPDGKLFVEAHAFGVKPRLRVWDVASGNFRCELKGHTGGIHVLAFSGDGKRLFSAGEDTTVLVWDVKTIHLEHLWNWLASRDPDWAARNLTASGDEATSFLRDHLRDAAVLEGRAARWVRDLDADDFDAREKASEELQKLGQEAEYVLRLAMEAKPSPEVKRRVGELLDRLQRTDPEKVEWDARRTLRAVAILSEIGTPAARNALRELSRGPADARVTQAAKATLDRLGGRE